MKKMSHIALGVVVPIIFSGCYDKKNLVNFDLESTPKKVESILKSKPKPKILYTSNTNENQEIESSTYINENQEIEKSIGLIWNNEFNFFISFFNLDTDEKILSKIESIQQENWLKIDRIIWPQTLKILYLNYYSEVDAFELPFDIAKRLEIFNEMQEYNNYPKRWTRYGTIYPSGVSNIFSSANYYWEWSWENIAWTYINKELAPFVDNNIEEFWTISIITEINWKYILKTYVNHELQLLTYISPWNPSLKWWIKTKLWEFTTKYSNMYFISSARDSIKETINWIKWAVMPYALNIHDGIFAHGWYVDWDKRSHGCVRQPYFYAKWLYEIYKNTWNMKWYILDN